MIGVWMIWMISVRWVSAQAGISAGLMGGVTMGSVKIDQTGTAFTDALKGNNVYGFEAGIYAKLRLSLLYLRPELLYDFRNGEVTYYDQNTGSDQKATFSAHKIELPVLIGVNLIGPLNIEAGSVYNYLLTVTDQYNNNRVDLGRNGLGYRFGANVELGGILLGLNYQGTAYTSGSNNASLSEPFKIIFSLGIRLGGIGSK